MSARTAIDSMKVHLTVQLAWMAHGDPTVFHYVLRNDLIATNNKVLVETSMASYISYVFISTISELLSHRRAKGVEHRT